MITNLDLIDIARRERIPLNDVFMKDHPPTTVSEGGYIINLQDQDLNKGGTHWVALWIGNKKLKEIAYMDSFGFLPPQSVLNWLKTTKYKTYKIFYNIKHIQNINSGGCGIYSLFFIDFMHRHHSNIPMGDLIDKYARLFSTDPIENLRILKSYAPYYKNSNVDPLDLISSHSVS